MTNDPHWPRASEWLAAGAEDPRFVVVGAPTSAGSISASQAHRTPAALRHVLGRFATYDAEADVDLRDLPARDDGDWSLADLSAEDAVTAVARQVGGLRVGPVHAFLGGDNLITYPIAANLPHADLSRTGVLTFDAHHDVRQLDDERFSNGSPIRLLLEDGLPGDRVVQIGIHSFANSQHYRRWCEDHGIGVVDLPRIERRGIAAVVEEALEDLSGLVEAIHVDFDIDVLDRAFAPGCPGARPGGLTPRALADAARICGRHPKVVSADFVEVDVAADVADTTLMALATTFLAFASGVAQRTAGT